jgi:signal peptide peptidase SppA
MNLALETELATQVWALNPETLFACMAYARDGGPRWRTDRRVSPSRQTPAGIAVLPMYGVMTQRASLMTELFGGTPLTAFSRALRAALADDAVQQVLIDIDSPGGSTFGVMELADEIYSARAKKPIVAIANSQAVCAAYWLGCSASEFYITPGGQVGSIGVYLAHEDMSGQLAKAGIKVTLIGAGKYKTEGNPYGGLDGSAKAFMQSRVDDVYAALTRGVARGRAVPVDQVRRGMGQGRALGADQALAAKMVDGIRTFDQVLQRMHTNAARATVARLTGAMYPGNVTHGQALLSHHGSR